MSKFQIVKGITDNLADTPYVEGKVYFVYNDVASTDLSIYADIDGARRKITPITFEEEDPTVPDWAKQETKPTYTAAEVGALPSTTSIPSKTSDLINDSNFQTSSEVNSAIVTAIGNINQFNVAIVSTLPTENIDTHTIYFMSNGSSDDNIYDEWMYINNTWERIGSTSVDLSGYMQTSHPANSITTNKINEWDAKLSSYTETDPIYAASPAAIITSEKITSWDAKSDFSGSYNDLSDKPTIPTVPSNISAFTNDSGYLTSYTETDPTVPAWAKAESKPTYTYNEVGAAASSHAHGSITNAGAITSNTAFANGDRLVFSDSSDSNLLKRSSITLGTSTTQYFANNGTWQNVPTTSVSQTLTTGTEIGKVNGTTLYAPNPYNDSALAARVTALENLEWATYYSGRQNPSDSQGTNGDIYLQY